MPFTVQDVQHDDSWGLMPPLGKVPWDVQDIRDDVKLNDVLLEMIYSKVRTSDVLFCEDVEDLLMMFSISLLDEVDKVNDVTDMDVLDFPTVLDEQGDVEVNLCDLLYDDL